jgi:comEA protein
MSSKRQCFLAGVLAGFILSGIVFLFINRANSPVSSSIVANQYSVEEQESDPPIPSSNQGKININNASLEELTKLSGIGPSKAAAIIDFRTKYGKFESVDELLYVPGFGEFLFSSIKDLITVE